MALETILTSPLLTLSTCRVSSPDRPHSESTLTSPAVSAGHSTCGFGPCPCSTSVQGISSHSDAQAGKLGIVVESALSLTPCPIRSQVLLFLQFSTQFLLFILLTTAYFFNLFVCFLGCTCSKWKFSGQGLNQSCSCQPTAEVRGPNCIYDLHHSSRQCRILNPLIKARAQTHILMDTSWVCNR